MVASVEHVLQTSSSTSLSDKDVHILDPFTGTGNFIVNLMRLIPKSALPQKYREELHCNELMLLPYYVASMNIEHAFWDATGLTRRSRAFASWTPSRRPKGTAAVRHLQRSQHRAGRAARKAPIKVIIANPPYNAGQVNENDNNKNRKYEEIDRRVRVTYGADSKATLVRKLSDPT